MKALVLEEYKKLVYKDVPEPQPGPEDVLVRVKACGICGSDVHGYDGSTGRRRPPIIMGHEAAGTVAGAGKGVLDWHEGDRVTFDSTIFCGECEFCRRGLINLCDRRRVLGVSCEEYRQNGAFAEYVAVPQRVLYRLPEKLPFEFAALLEPFAIALHAVNRARPEPNDTAVVLGAGMIGLGLVQVLKAIGCQKVVVVDIAADRLARAEKFGATRTVNSANENAEEVIKSVTRGEGSDRAYEAVGLDDTVSLAVRSVRKGGSVVLVGNLKPSVSFPLQAVVTRELSVYGSCASKGEYPACLELMAKGALAPAPLISATAPLSEGAAWFERLYGHEAGLLKVVLKP